MTESNLGSLEGRPEFTNLGLRFSAAGSALALPEYEAAIVVSGIKDTGEIQEALRRFANLIKQSSQVSPHRLVLPENLRGLVNQAIDRKTHPGAIVQAIKCFSDEEGGRKAIVVRVGREEYGYPSLIYTKSDGGLGSDYTPNMTVFLRDGERVMLATPATSDSGTNWALTERVPNPAQYIVDIARKVTAKPSQDIGVVVVEVGSASKFIRGVREWMSAGDQQTHLPATTPTRAEQPPEYDLTGGKGIRVHRLPVTVVLPSGQVLEVGTVSDLKLTDLPVRDPGFVLIIDRKEFVSSGYKHGYVGLPDDSHVTIGRKHLDRLRYRKGIANEHAEIRRHRDEIIIRDLG